MLIRSQDGDDLVNIDNIADIKASFGDIEASAHGLRYQLGRYKDDKATHKVMDMIEEAYEKGYSFYSVDEQDGDSFQMLFSHPIVFHMPKDEEVEV